MVAGLTVMPLDGAGNESSAPTLATTLDIGGLLRDDQRSDRPSFDVQLAELNDSAAAALRQRVPQRSTCAVQSRLFSSGCESRPAPFAPAGSNRSSHGGNEMAEAFGVEGNRAGGGGPFGRMASEAHSMSLC